MSYYIALYILSLYYQFLYYIQKPVWLFLFVLLFVISPTFIFIKKRNQIGKTWWGPVQATVSIKNKTLNCSHCGHDKFDKREGILNTSWVMFFRFGFWNRSASCFICRDCGFLHWFVSPDEKAKIQRDL